MPELLLSTTAGLHVPEIPLFEVFGRVGTVPPAQMLKDVPKENAGVVLGVTTTLRMVGIPHCPAVGVKVYEPEAMLLITAGLQVPLRPLLDTVGSAGGVVPAQKGAMGANVGVYTGLDRITPVFK